MWDGCVGWRGDRHLGSLNVGVRRGSRPCRMGWRYRSGVIALHIPNLSDRHTHEMSQLAGRLTMVTVVECGSGGGGGRDGLRNRVEEIFGDPSLHDVSLRHDGGVLRCSLPSYPSYPTSSSSPFSCTSSGYFSLSCSCSSSAAASSSSSRSCFSLCCNLHSSLS